MITRIFLPAFPVGSDKIMRKTGPVACWSQLDLASYCAAARIGMCA
jgi:hypothetical protein